MTSTALPELFTSRSDWAVSRLQKSLHTDPAQTLHAMVARHSELLLAHIRKFAPDHEDTRDLMQDVCLQILKKGHTYAGTGSMLSWALSVARNTCLSALRRPDHRYTVQPGESSSGSSVIESLPDRDTPYVVTERTELGRDLDRAISRLAPRQRAIVVMRLVEGLSTRETAARLGCSSGTVKGSLFRAKRQLQTELAAWRS